MKAESSARPDDAVILAAYARRIGVTTDTLLDMMGAALAEHLRHHPNIPVPIELGLPSPHCATCPHAQRQAFAESIRDNIVTFPGRSAPPPENR